MEESPDPLSAIKEGIKHHFDSPKNSDVALVIRERQKAKRSYEEMQGGASAVPSPAQKLYAHKIVLAAGSRAFEQHFEDSPEAITVDVTGIVDCSETVALGVARYIYGLTPFTEEAVSACRELDRVSPLFLDVFGPSPGDWTRLREAADRFGIPSLHKHITTKLEPSLRALLELTLPFMIEDPADAYFKDHITRPFFDEVMFIQELEEDEDIEGEEEQQVAAEDRIAKDMAIGLCRKNYTALQKTYDFNSFTDRHPGLPKSMLEYVARKGSGVLG